MEYSDPSGDGAPSLESQVETTGTIHSVVPVPWASWRYSLKLSFAAMTVVALLATLASRQSSWFIAMLVIIVCIYASYAASSFERLVLPNGRMVLAVVSRMLFALFSCGMTAGAIESTATAPDVVVLLTVFLFSAGSGAYCVIRAIQLSLKWYSTPVSTDDPPLSRVSNQPVDGTRQ